MPGCGKSTVGRHLARQLGRPFADADAEVEREMGCSIRDYFGVHGESVFRDVEQRVIDELTRTWAHLAPRLNASPDDQADFIDTIGVRAELLRIDSAMLAQANSAGLRDPNDLPVLALLLGSGADHLVTGDKDLLVLADTYPILSPAEFVYRFVP